MYNDNMNEILILGIELVSAVVLFIGWAWTARTFYDEGYKQGIKDATK